MEYKIGKIVKGNITGIENYGIFVNLDNYYSGLIHISEMSCDFVKDPNTFVKVGDTIYVKILDIDEETNHMKLSIKDINYRVCDKISKIEEVGSGFNILQENLNDWINEKLDEMRNV